MALRAILFAILAAAWPSLEAPSVQADEPSPVLLDNMDDATPGLKLLNAGPSVRLLAQSIEPGRARFGTASERIRLSAPAGVSAHLGYDLPPAKVLVELRLAAWVSCNRPGAQLAATVVLPRTLDPRTGLPRTLLVRGTSTSRGSNSGNDWQLLTLDNLPDKLADHVRVARAKYGGDIDERGARAAQLVILTPGGPGVTELWVDQITMHGILASHGDLAATPSGIVPAAAASPVTAPAAGVVAKVPAVPRIIQWQGEPLETLQRLGFDAVWMGRLPTSAELAETTRLGMFIVCPPPAPEQLAANGIGAEYAQVLAWDLGELVENNDLEPAHHWAQVIEKRECAPDRPTLLRPHGMTLEASRIADALMLSRPMLGSTQTWPDYAVALSLQRRLARAGTPVWVNIETHAGAHYRAQLAALRGEGPAIVPATFDELSRATTAAFGVMPRGFCFQSLTSLAAEDPQNRMRALALELTNLRLGLADPWLAAGKAATAARSTQPDLTGMVLKVERSHLIVPQRWGAASAPAVTAAGGEPLAFDLPGVPESSDAYLVSISGSERLRARRVTGGLRIELDHLPDDAFVLVTEDGYAFSHIERYLRAHAPRAAQARVELAALRRQSAARALAALPPAAVAESGAQEQLAGVDRQLTAVIETIRRRDFAAAFACAAEAERLLEESQHRLAKAIAPELPVGASPVPRDWSTLADLARINHALASSAAGPQSIPGGEFEDLTELLSGGWQRLQNLPRGIQAAVRLSPEAPARGAYCLELDATSEAPGNRPPLLPTPPVWVTSPPLAVPPNHLVEIMGMVRVGEVPMGSPDPLLVFDSIGGEESALRFSSAPSWTPFRLVRAAPSGGELRITIALGGLGRAQVDSLTYRFIPLKSR